MGKTNKTKISPGDFKVTIPENSLLSKQVVTSKRILVPYTNLQLNIYPNTQLDLFCSDNLSFQYTAPSTWLTNYADPNTLLQSPSRESCWLQSYSVHPDDEDQEAPWLQNPLCTNVIASSRERWIRANCLKSQFEWIRANCLLKTILIYV